MISIIHPTRNRPEMALKTYERWCEASSTDIEYILSIDNDDENNYDFPWFEGVDINGIRGDNKNAVQAINAGAKIAKWDILIVVSDDFDCPVDWDTEILKIAKGKKDFLLKTKDGIQNWMVTLPIMDREYYNRFGYIYHPDYEHMFCDTELTCVAELTGRLISCTLQFEHNHYSKTGIKDDVSVKADSTWNKGQSTFIDHARQNFGLSPEQVRGRITDKKMINWLKVHAKIDYSYTVA